MFKGLLKKIKEFFFGRPLTKHDILRDRLRICILTGTRPSDVKNFWMGIEELKGLICPECQIISKIYPLAKQPKNSYPYIDYLLFKRGRRDA